MNSRERLTTVLQGRIPDRVPISPRIGAWLMEYVGGAGWTHHLKIKQMGFDYDPIIITGGGFPNLIYSQVENPLTAVDVAITTTTRWLDGKCFIRRDIETPAGPLHDEMVYPPAGKIYGINPNPEKLEPLVQSAEDLERVRYLLPDPRKSGNTDFEDIDAMIGDEGMLEVRPHIGVDHLLADSFGIVPAMLLIHDDPPLLERALDIFQAHYRECLQTVLERGAKQIFESWYNCSMSTGWPPQVWRDLFLPRIKANVELTHQAGATFHFYDDGRIMPILDDLATVGMDMISTLCPAPVGDADLPEVKRRLGNRVTLNGGVDLQTIRFGTADEVEAEVRAVLDVLAPGGRFILGTSDSIRDGSPEENVRRFFEIGRAYGVYH